MDNGVIELIKKKISEYKEELKDHLAMGGVSDYSEYMRLVGRHETLNLLGADLVEIEKRLIEE